jgi:hypothetical protein
VNSAEVLVCLSDRRTMISSGYAAMVQYLVYIHQLAGL